MSLSPSRILFVACFLAINVAGLVPHSRSKSRRTPQIDGQNNHDWAIKFNGESISSTAASIRQTEPQKKKKGENSEEFSWFNWVYHQWVSTEVGKLSKATLKQMAAAISKWSRRKTHIAALRGEEILERIIQENLAGNKDAVLTISLFNSAMDGFAKIGDPVGVQRILRRIECLRGEYPNELAHLTPDVFSMSTLATAWAKSRLPEASTNAEAILQFMDARGMSPNTITYNAILHAIASGNEIDRAIRAENVLKRMKQEHMAGGDCSPDVYSYQCIIQAWASTPFPGSPQRAEQILRFLDLQSEQEDSQNLAPNAYCFTTTIHAWARSSERNRARSAYQILQHMRRRYMEKGLKHLKPNVVAFTAVLNACALPMCKSERDDAFQVAELTMSELSLGIYDKPNFLSYAAFLSVCATTLCPGDKRDGVVKLIFEECCQVGQVAEIVLEKLKLAASPDLCNTLVGTYTTSDSLPSEWTSGLTTGISSTRQKPSFAARDTTHLPASSLQRLKQVQKFQGKSGIYSSGKGINRLETNSIRWSKDPLKF